MQHPFDFDSLEMSARAQGALRQLGVTSLDELITVREADVRSLRNAGNKTWAEIADLQVQALRKMAETSAVSADRPAPAETDLRDRFAEAALVGLPHLCSQDTLLDGISFEQHVARNAYKIADAMLAARSIGAA